jgi:hypothetical protein
MPVDNLGNQYGSGLNYGRDGNNEAAQKNGC